MYNALMKTTGATPVIRLAKRPDFVNLTKRGERFVTKGFILQYLPRANAGEEVRIGFTASKKLSKSAVVRNRAKRRLRAVVDVTARLNPAFTAPPMDMCLIARYATCDLPFEKLVADLTKALRHAGAQL